MIEREGPEPFSPYPDCRYLLTELLERFAKTGYETPTTWKNNLPYIRVLHIGGQDDGWTDRQRVDIYVHVADSPGAARQGQLLAERIRQFLERTPHYVENGDTIEHVRVFTSPNEITSLNDSVRRWYASYEVHVSRTARITP